MYATPFTHQEVLSVITSDPSLYITSFGAKSAPNKLDIFYSVECGFSREFLQHDFKILLEKFTLTGKAFIQLHPAALDATTLAFAEMIYSLSPHEKRQIFMQLCHDNAYYKALLSRTSSMTLSDRVFCDVTQFLEEHSNISETLMIKVNGVPLKDVPSVYALEEILNKQNTLCF